MVVNRIILEQLVLIFHSTIIFLHYKIRSNLLNYMIVKILIYSLLMLNYMK
jgi:hypothetical protein